MHPKDPIAFVKDMGVGWNMGNSFDSIGPDETAWGNPTPTTELVDAIADRGFRTIRIPVTWHLQLGDAPDYAIDQVWLDRVEGLVRHALDRHMYVVLNTHHENEWTIPSYEKVEAVSIKLEKLWTQIALRFRDYSDRLVFEPLNETRIEGAPHEWSGGDEEERDCINTFQKVALEAIRATGGNNATRMILISQHAASTHQEVMDALIIPNDDPNTLISVHVYYPVPFTLFDSPDWGTDEDKVAMEEKLDSIHAHFVAKGKGVVIGEWGSTNNGDLPNRIEHARHFVREARRRDMATIWWDNGGENEFGIINRHTLDWFFPEIVEAILEEGTGASH
jgi:endoglucanase